MNDEHKTYFPDAEPFHVIRLPDEAFEGQRVFNWHGDPVDDDEWDDDEVPDAEAD